MGCRSPLIIFQLLLPALALPALAQDQQPQLPDQTGSYYRRIISDVESRLGRFEYRPFRQRGSIGQVDPGWTQLGFVPFVRAWGRAIYPNSLPMPEEMGAEAAVFAAPGEIEPVSFCLRSLESEVSGLRLTPGALVNLTAESYIPPDSVEIGVVEYFPVRWGKGSSSRLWRWHPVRIWPAGRFPGNRFCVREPPGTFRVPPATTVQFWIRVHTPEDIQPGEYTGSVLVEHWGGTYRLPLTFTVLPVALRRRGLPPFGVFVPGPLDRYACQDLAAHGISSVARWYNPVQLPLRFGEAGVEPDFRLEDIFMRNLGEAGIDGPQIVYASGAGRSPFDSSLAAAVMGRPETELASGALIYAQAVQLIDKHASSAGWPRLVWGLLDRASDWGDVRGRITSRARALNRVMGYRANMVSPLLSANDDEVVEDLDGLMSVWLVSDDVRPDEAMRRSAVWGYTALTQRDSAGAARMKLGFGAWRAQRDGMFVWAYNWSGGGHNWNDFDSSRMDWMLSYRNLDDSFLPTPAWEGVREGIEDRRYLRTLHQLINSAPSGSAAAIDALQFLETVRQPAFDLAVLPAFIPEAAPQSSDSSPAGLIRRALAGYIISLAAQQQPFDSGR